MPSMYETIRELPLFKGIGDEHLSSLLEKTSLDFIKLEPGDYLWHKDDPVKSLGFILNGIVSQVYKLKNFDLSIEERLGKGSVIGAQHLFGLIIRHPSSALAVSSASVMTVDKEQYMKILSSDQIYLLNYLNYLSASTQRRGKSYIDIKPYTIANCLKIIGFNLSTTLASEIRFNGSDSEFAKLLNIPVETFREWKNREASLQGFSFEDNSLILKKEVFI